MFMTGTVTSSPQRMPEPLPTQSMPEHEMDLARRLAEISSSEEGVDRIALCEAWLGAQSRGIARQCDDQSP